jgi:hypothetical protein
VTAQSSQSDPILEPPLPWFLCMAEEQQIAKPCPVCGVAMMRQDKDDGAILYRCCLCKTEVKIAPATNKPKEAKPPASLVLRAAPRFRPR